MLATTKEYFSDLLRLFYPDICLACSAALLADEEILCFKCESELPQTGHWLDPDNSIMKRLQGRVEVQGAAALFQFQKGGNVQHLIHQLKYKGRQEVGEYIGKMFGNKLKEPGSIIKDVDLVVPVPLHWKKLKKRGYNQCDSFAKGLAETLDIPWFPAILERRLENVSQAGKRRYDRWQNVQDIFSLSGTQQIEGKHVLLVDDVVTTGATAEACMHTLLSAGHTKTSFLAIAVALQ